MLKNCIKRKEPERQELNRLIEEYLKQGKKIQVIESSDDPEPSKKVYDNETL